MADITNTQAIRFANEKARVLSDLIESMDRSCQQFMLDVVRDWELVAQVDAAGNSDKIVDGSVVDGRNPRTKFNVGELKYVVEQILAAMSVGDRRTVVHGWVTNGQPKF